MNTKEKKELLKEVKEKIKQGLKNPYHPITHKTANYYIDLATKEKESSHAQIDSTTP